MESKNVVVVQILDKKFEIFINSDEIQKKIESLAREINQEFNGQEVIFVAVLNGAFMFASDLMKCIDLKSEITFVKMSSYKGMESSGKVEELIGLKNNLRNKNIVIIEDIVDSGITMDKIIDLVQDQEPKQVKICTLLFKPDAFKGVNHPHYIGFSIPNAFVVGYGLDYDEKGRNLDAIYQIKE